MKKILTTVMLIIATASAGAGIIQVGFSGTIEVNHFDVPPDTIVFGSFTYDSDATFELVGFNKVFSAESASVTFLNETATINSGYIIVNDDSLSFSAGPALGLSNALSNPEAFSNDIAGINIRGLGFNVEAAFTDGNLPDETTNIYGGNGSFFVNRSIGALFDVNSPDLLRVPQSPSNSANSPAIYSLLIICLVFIFGTRVESVIRRQQ